MRTAAALMLFSKAPSHCSYMLKMIFITYKTPAKDSMVASAEPSCAVLSYRSSYRHPARRARIFSCNAMRSVMAGRWQMINDALNRT